MTNKIIQNIQNNADVISAKAVAYSLPVVAMGYKAYQGAYEFFKPTLEYVHDSLSHMQATRDSFTDTDQAVGAPVAAAVVGLATLWACNKLFGKKISNSVNSFNEDKEFEYNQRMGFLQTESAKDASIPPEKLKLS